MNTPAVRIAEKVALSVPEAAQLTGLSSSSITRLVRRGVLATVPHVGRVLIARRELDRWVESGAQLPPVSVPVAPTTDTRRTAA